MSLSFGTILRVEFAKQNISSTDIAKEISISRQYLCDIQQDRILPGIKTLAKLDKKFPQLKLFDEYKKSI